MWNFSLKVKALLILLGVFTLSGVVEYIIQQQIVYPSFIALEKSEAERNLQRAVQAINREIHHLDSFNHDWAAWDETYEFIENYNQDFIDSNLVDSTFTDNAINVVYFVAPDGRVVWGKILDLETEKEMTLAGFPKNSMPKEHPLTCAVVVGPLNKTKCQGVIITDNGPMLVSSRPIITSNNEGPPRGFIIIGKFLTEDLLQTLVDQTQVDFTISTFKSAARGEEENTPNHSFSSDVFHLPDDQLTEHFAYQDITGKDAFMVSANTPRTISRQGVVTIRYAILSIAVAALLFLVMALLLLQKSILGPISYLTNHVLDITQTGDLSARVGMKRPDEIGKLAEEFDGMMDELEDDKIKINAMNQALRKDIQHQKLMALEQSRAELAEREVMRNELLSHTVLAQEKERMRIARELHDETSQALTAAGFTLEALKRMMPKKSEARQLVDQLRKIDDGIATGIKRLIENLRPVELENLGMVAALQTLADETARNTDVKVSIKVGGTQRRLDNLIETVIFRVAQEALTNIIRYAFTDEAIIALQFEDDCVGLFIHDEGKGFDTKPLKTTRKGWGIEGMRERVESVGGQFELQSTVGKGTIIKVVVGDGAFL